MMHGQQNVKSLTFIVQPFKCQVSAAAIAVFNFNIHCGTVFSLVNAKGVNLMGHLPDNNYI